VKQKKLSDLWRFVTRRNFQFVNPSRRQYFSCVSGQKNIFIACRKEKEFENFQPFVFLPNSFSKKRLP